ncbi:MAG: hypothetical protein ILNGONEN_01504 [Syntrophorhabdaceae bacterium]|nr:hypothetical protein [Syntrophorhabdaceae bacterium]
MVKQMDKKRGRQKNLVPQSERTKEEQRKIARMGGIASGKARREKKLLSQIYGELLAKSHNMNIDGITTRVKGERLVELVALHILLKRDSSSVSMLKEIREATEGSLVNIEGHAEMQHSLGVRIVAADYDEKL